LIGIHPTFLQITENNNLNETAKFAEQLINIGEVRKQNTLKEAGETLLKLCDEFDIGGVENNLRRIGRFFSQA
jgi:hypothetical protein